MHPEKPCPACGAPLTIRNGDPLLENAAVDRLRAWRRTRAGEEGVAAYVILPNATLHEIALTRPESLGALAEVRGMGPTRLERHGEAILAALEPDGLLDG